MLVAGLEPARVQQGKNVLWEAVMTSTSPIASHEQKFGDENFVLAVIQY